MFRPEEKQTFVDGPRRWLSFTPHVVRQESRNDVMETLEGGVAIWRHQLIGHLVSQHVEPVGYSSFF